jgi:hypothetical protein
MSRSTYRTIPLAGLSAGSAPATWGQRAMWDIVHAMAPDTEHLNLMQFLPVPPGLTVDAVLAALADTVAVYESLRTRLMPTADGLHQVLPEVDELLVELYEAAGEDLDTLARTLSARLMGTRFNPGTEPGFRALVGTLSGVPAAVLLVFSHLAADMTSTRIVRAAIAARLAAAGTAAGTSHPVGVGRQPREQAGFEASPRGRRLDARSLRYARRQFAAAPGLPPGACAEPEPVRFVRGTLRSAAVALATDELARRYHTSCTTVLVAAAALALGRATGLPRCPLMLIAANRVTAGLRDAVGTITQSTLAVIDVTGDTFGDAVRATWSASMGAFQHAQYDPDALAGVRQEVEAKRGVALTHTWFVNDLREKTLPSGQTHRSEAVRAATASSAFAWHDSRPREHMTFMLAVTDGDDGSALLSVLADTAAFPRSDARRLVESIEELLVADATAAVAAPW